MSNINFKCESDILTVYLEGRIDTTNSNETETVICGICESNKYSSLILDCEKLDYISSAGLRVILRLKKTNSDVKLINVSPDVYEIFETTGFTEMMDISKAYRVISVEGCEAIGQGANGKVYRIDPETIVKVYINPDALPEIHRERELARTAFVNGIPTAIPYDVVRIEGGGYGSVFELLNAVSFAKLLIKGEKTVDEIAKMSVDLLKEIHATVVKPNSMPDMKKIALGWVEFLKDYLPADKYEKLYGLVNDVPEDNHMIHGDYHIKNVMLQNGESLLIDMDTLCHGNPVFEFASIYNAYVGFADVDHEVDRRFLGISYEDGKNLWNRILQLYFGTEDEEKLGVIEEKAKLLGHVRILRREIRRDGFNREDGKIVIENSKKIILDLIDKVDTLSFS